MDKRNRVGFTLTGFIHYRVCERALSALNAVMWGNRLLEKIHYLGRGRGRQSTWQQRESVGTFLRHTDCISPLPLRRNKRLLALARLHLGGSHKCDCKKVSLYPIIFITWGS